MVAAMTSADLRTTVERQVAGLRATDEHTAETQRRFLADLGRLAHPFDEHADLTHVTGTAVVISDFGVLLHRHKRLAIWVGPGGHLNPGETPWDAAVRETTEETGIRGRHPAETPTLLHVDVHHAGLDHLHLDLRYLLVAEGVAPKPGPGESQAVGWYAEPEALERTDNSYRPAVASGFEAVGSL